MSKGFQRREFPKLRPDGSFCIEVRLRVSTDQLELLASRVTEWFDGWVRQNRYWKMPTIRKEGKGMAVFDYFDDFARPPSCAASPPDSVVLRLEGRPGGKWWRGWLASRIVKELRVAFKEIGKIEKAVNCPE
jgi:hypothetical protein